MDLISDWHMVDERFAMTPVTEQNGYHVEKQTSVL
jgi:hypothetical protein